MSKQMFIGYISRETFENIDKYIEEQEDLDVGKFINLYLCATKGLINLGEKHSLYNSTCIPQYETTHYYKADDMSFIFINNPHEFLKNLANNYMRQYVVGLENTKTALNKLFMNYQLDRYEREEIVNLIKKLSNEVINYDEIRNNYDMLAYMQQSLNYKAIEVATINQMFDDKKYMLCLYSY